jgi:hypothetical protein
MTKFLKPTTIAQPNIKDKSMSQVIMILLFPIGLYFYFFKERPSRPAYNKVFTDFETEIQEDTSLLETNKIQHYKEMLLKNEYKIINTTSHCIIGEKRIFSMSLFAMSVGFYYVGAVIYLLYFYYFQTPHRVTFKINKDTSC